MGLSTLLRSVSISRWLPLQFGDLDLEGSGQPTGGAYKCGMAGLDPRHGGLDRSDAPGELPLGEATLNAPVRERRQHH